MAQNYLEGLFIDAPSRSSFNNLLTLGRVRNDQIAFIKDTNEIWTQGHFYNCNGSTVSDIINVVKNNFSEITPEIEQVIQNKVASWALKNNTDLIPQNKLPNIPESKLPNRLVIVGSLNGNDFYVNNQKVTGQYGNLYVDEEGTNKGAYIWKNGTYEKISSTDTSGLSVDWSNISNRPSIISGIRHQDNVYNIDSQGLVDLGELVTGIKCNNGNIYRSTGSDGRGVVNLGSVVKTINGGIPDLDGNIDLEFGGVGSVKINNETKSPTNGVVDLGGIATNIKFNGSTKTPATTGSNKGQIDLGTVSVKVDNSTTVNAGTNGQLDLTNTFNQYAKQSNIGNGTVNIICDSTNSNGLGSFTTNQSTDKTINIYQSINGLILPVYQYIANEIQKIWNAIREYHPQENIYFFGQAPLSLNISNYSNYLNYNTVPQTFETQINEYVWIIIPKQITVEEDQQQVTKQLVMTSGISSITIPYEYQGSSGIIESIYRGETSDGNYYYIRSNSKVSPNTTIKLDNIRYE